MEALELLELGGILAFQGRSAIEDAPRLCDEALAEYWASSRCRFDEWGRSLRRLSDGVAAASGQELLETTQEILVSEPLTRIVAAVCLAHDRQWSLAEAAPIGRNVLAGHTEAFQRLKTLLRARRSAAERELAGATALAERLHRWTDMFLAYLGSSPATLEFAFDRERVNEFAADAHSHREFDGAAEPLLLASVRGAFSCAATSANPELNHRIAAATIGLFGAEAFDSYGLLRSTWIARLERITEEAMVLAAESVGPEEDPLSVRRQKPKRWKC